MALIDDELLEALGLNEQGKFFAKLLYGVGWLVLVAVLAFVFHYALNGDFSWWILGPLLFVGSFVGVMIKQYCEEAVETIISVHREKLIANGKSKIAAVVVADESWEPSVETDWTPSVEPTVESTPVVKAETNKGDQ